MYPNTHNAALGHQQAMQQRPSLIGAHENIGSQVAEKPEVMREGDMLRREVDILTETIETLVRRLEPVIKAVPTTATMQQEQKMPDCYSAIGSDLRSLGDRLRGQSARLCGVLESLAV